MIGGIISGLDTTSIIDSLIAVESQPLTRLQSQRGAVQSDISQLATLKSKMANLASTLGHLKDTETALSYGATVSDTAKATASGTGSAVAGSYELKINTLAAAEKDRSGAFAGSTDIVKAGTLTLAVYGEDAVDIEIAEGATLADVREAINGSGAKVSATIINTGTESRLQITSLKSGHELGGAASDALTITESYTGAGGTELAFTETQTASNATFELDGLAIESATNEVTDALEGVTLNLLAKTADGAPVTLTIAPDDNTMVQRVKDFVSAYNDVMKELAKTNAPSTAMYRRARGELQNTISSAVSGLEGAFQTLTSLGLDTDAYSGNLVLNETDLREALASDAPGAMAVFTHEESGIAAAMTTVLERYTESQEGLIKVTEDSLDAKMDRLDGQIESQSARIERYRTRLNRQFTTLELLMADLQDDSARIDSLVTSG